MSHREKLPLLSSTTINAVPVVTTIEEGSPCILEQQESSTTQKARRALTAAIVFCFCFMIAEFAGGIYTHSLAVLNDAVHMITDVATLSLSLMAVHATSWKSCDKYSYGWRRAEVVGALASVFATWALVVWILVEAVMRLVTIFQCANGDQSPECFSIDAPVMTYIGIAGFFANVACACILHWGGHHGHSHGSFGEEHDDHSDHDDHGHAHDDHDEHGHGHDDHDHDDHGHSHDDHGHGHDEHHDCSGHNSDNHDDHHGHGHGNMNLRGAFLHVIGDCLQSLGVVLAAGIIWGLNVRDYGEASVAHSYANIADPFCSMLFGIITMFTTINLFRDIFRVLMECTPKGVSYEKILQQLRGIESVTDVKDLHIWSLGSEGAVLSTHLILAKDVSISVAKEVLRKAEAACKKAGVNHTTIQLNYANDDDDHDHGHGCSGHGHSH